MSISILDMPSDIMFKIFMMVSGDFHLHPFLNLRSNWCGNRISIRNRNEINSFISLFLYRGSRSLRYNSQSYSNYCMNNTLRMLPSNICILSRVCKNFKTELLTEPYWETLYIRDFRKGKPYVHKKPQSFYKEKYYNLIYEYFESLKKVIKAKSGTKKLLKRVKLNNSEIYLDCIEAAVQNLSIDVPILYKINGLQQLLSDTVVGEFEVNLPFHSVVANRRSCLAQAHEYGHECKKLNAYLKKYENITRSKY